VLLSFIFVLQVAAAISAFVLRGQVNEMLVRTMNDSIVNYNENKSVAEAVDFMQSMVSDCKLVFEPSKLKFSPTKKLECCGVTDPNDWSGILDPSNNATDVPVPDSCCVQFMDDDHSSCLSFHNVGCFNKMHFIISQSTMLLAVGATTVAFVQILGVICAFMLAKTIRRTKSLRAARRWQLQQSLGIMAKSFGTQVYDPEYTQMAKSEKGSEPSTYLPNSPSVN
jgi:CD63 antigen